MSGPAGTIAKYLRNARDRQKMEFGISGNGI
jgi:hypothetical protein